ncbi:MAG: V-type ATPase subunit [Sedimentibacter sp.]|uniref:V-type ATPase subunit n=1 Tax=Sedimentibacter sp. TaxID=1960295 RepID=UPI003158DC3D
MNPNMAYYAIQTKIISKKGHLIRELDWEKLLECKTVDQVKSLMLDNKELSKLMYEVKNEEINRDRMEVLLGRFKTVETEDLLHYFSGNYKEFIKSLLLVSELQDLSLILRRIAREETLEGIEERFVHSKKHETLPFDNLMSSKNVAQFTENLKGTPYYSGLKNLTKEDAINREFHIEMKLYVELYRNLMEYANKLDKDDKDAALELIGLKIDLLNVQWIYRALNYYKISPEEILIYSLVGGKSIDYKKLKKLCYSKSMEEFFELVKSYLKLDIFSNMDVLGFDLSINSYSYEYLRKKKFRNIGAAVSYIYLIGIIVDDFTTIVEGIKYNVPKEKLKEYLAYRM